MSVITLALSHPALVPAAGTACTLPAGADTALATIRGWFVGFLILGGPAAALACLAGMLLGHFARMRRLSESSQESLVWVVGIEIVAGLITGIMTAVTTVTC